MPWRALLSENGLTFSTVAASGMTWLMSRGVLVGQTTSTVEWTGIVVTTIGLAALIVRTYGEAAKVRAAERIRQLDHQHEERMARSREHELTEKLTRLEARDEYYRRMCVSGVCPFPNPDGSARCEGSDLPLSLERSPVVVHLPDPPPPDPDAGQDPPV
jgi:hypothetical protein